MNENDIRLGIIVNNYGKEYDGIGAYSQAISSHFSNKIIKRIYTGYCVESDKVISKLTILGMTKAILGAIKELDDLDMILMEYPFVEWNPLIVPIYYHMASRLKTSNKKLVLSLHEYSRVNALRKIVIRKLLKKADIVLVSDEGMKIDISQYANNIYVRNIPTNITGNLEHKDIEKAKNNFVYFGLINKAKAFYEMLEAWDEFNSKGKYRLNILTGTKLDWDDSKHRNVKYIYRADNDEVFRIMSESMFNIVPVKPEVDMKNATFKTGCLAGCISIGKFCEQLSQLEFVLNVDTYDSNVFINIFNNAKDMSVDYMSKCSKGAQDYGKQYEPDVIAKNVEMLILEEL